MFTTVIIPAYEAGLGLGRCLAALSQQTLAKERFEVIVVDNAPEGSPGLGDTIVGADRVLRESRPGSYAARNAGIAAARGDVLAFTDADCEPSPTWLERGLAAVAALAAVGTPGAVGGQIEMTFGDPDHPTPVELYDAVCHMEQRRFVEKHGFAATANLFVDRRTFDRVGRFDANRFSGGDGEWGQRCKTAGVPLVFAADAIVRHPSRANLGVTLRRLGRIAGGRFLAQKRTGLHGLREDLGQDARTIRHEAKRLLRSGRVAPGQWPALAGLLGLCFVARVGENLRLRAGGTPRR